MYDFYERVYDTKCTVYDTNPEQLMSNTTGNYWLRSNTERNGEEETMYTEQFPPLPGTPFTPVEAEDPVPAAQPDDAMDVLNTVQSTKTTIAEQMSSLAERVAD